MHISPPTERKAAMIKINSEHGDITISNAVFTTITSMTDLTMAKKGYKAGDTVTLTVYRSGEYITLDLTFDQQPQTTGEETQQDTQQNPQQGSDYSDLFRDFYNYYFGQNGR